MAVMMKAEAGCEHNRGDVWMADLSGVIGAEQGGRRPVLICSNQSCNAYGPTVTIIPITTATKKRLPTHVDLHAGKYNLERDSIALCEQVRTISKLRLEYKLATLPEEAMTWVKRGLDIQLGL